MKKYLAIGHFRDSKNMTSVSMKNNSMADFRTDLSGNEFIPYVIFTEKAVYNLADVDSFDLFDIIKKKTSNYRKWNDIYEYIDQCYDIMLDKLANA